MFLRHTAALRRAFPRVRGGMNNLENRAYSCGGCNGAKYDCIEASDPTTGLLTALFNPRRDRWSEHFVWNAEETEMIGISATGRATISRLRLNRPEVVALRRVSPYLPRPSE